MFGFFKKKKKDDNSSPVDADALMQPSDSTSTVASPPTSIVEEQVFLNMLSFKRFNIVITIASLVISFIALISSIVIVAVGKDKDKVIVLDSLGRPVMLKQDMPDIINLPELEIFIKDFVPPMLNWDYAEVQDENAIREHWAKLAYHYDYDFLNKFSEVMKNIYFPPIISQRNIIKAVVDGIDRFQYLSSGKEVQANITVRFNSIVVGNESTTKEQITYKKYILKVRKGVRTLENPYGLYIYYFTESSN